MKRLTRTLRRLLPDPPEDDTLVMIVVAVAIAAGLLMLRLEMHHR